jgi:hypothetical protein
MMVRELVGTGRKQRGTCAYCGFGCAVYHPKGATEGELVPYRHKAFVPGTTRFAQDWCLGIGYPTAETETGHHRAMRQIRIKEAAEATAKRERGDKYRALHAHLGEAVRLSDELDMAGTAQAAFVLQEQVTDRLIDLKYG